MQRGASVEEGATANEAPEVADLKTAAGRPATGNP